MKFEIEMLLANGNFWAAISSIGGSVSAIAAFIIVWNSRQANKEALEALRPYFMLEAPGIKQLPGSPPFRVLLTLKNIGGRVANNLDGRIYIVDNQPNSRPILDLAFSVANDIPPQSPTPWYNDTLQLAAQLPPHYVILGIRYQDHIMNRKLKQLFCMRWDGVNNGIFQPDFVHISSSEYKQIESKIAAVFGEFI